MHIDRFAGPRSTVALIVVATFFIPAHSAPVPDSLRLDKTSLHVQLSWLPDGGPYGVYRAGGPVTPGDVASYLTLRETLSYNDELAGLPDLVYYLVDDPPDCGVGPCTGAFETLADIDLPVGATANRAIDHGDYAYVASGPEGLTIIDIVDPTAPGVVGNWSETALDDCNDIVKIGDYVYIACGTSGTKGVSVNDPTNPFLVATMTTVGAVTVGSIGNALYVGVDATVQIWDVSMPMAPLFRGVRDPGTSDPLVRIWVDGNHIYCLYANGAITIYDASNPFAPVELASFATMPSATDLTVRNGIAYCTYLGAGVRIYDLRDSLNPTLLWHDGGSDARGVAVRGRTLICSYADGRVVTLGLRDPRSPQVLSASFGPSTPSSVSVFENGVAWCGYGTSGSLVDIPPFVLSQSPRSGSSGMCAGDSEVLLRFNSQIDPATVDGSSVAVEQAGNSVGGSLAVNGTEVTFTPDPGAIGEGTYDTTVVGVIDNLRGTSGPIPGYHGTFTIAQGCTEWTSTPGSVIAGMPASLVFQVFGSISVIPEVLISTDPDPADPFAVSQVVPASGGPSTFTAQWVAPSVDVPTTYYVIVRAEIDGDIAYGPIEDITVNP